MKNFILLISVLFFSFDAYAQTKLTLDSKANCFEYDQKFAERSVKHTLTTGTYKINLDNGNFKWAGSFPPSAYVVMNLNASSGDFKTNQEDTRLKATFVTLNGANDHIIVNVQGTTNLSAVFMDQTGMLRDNSGTAVISITEQIKSNAFNGTWYCYWANGTYNGTAVVDESKGTAKYWDPNGQPQSITGMIKTDYSGDLPTINLRNGSQTWEGIYKSGGMIKWTTDGTEWVRNKR